MRYDVQFPSLQNSHKLFYDVSRFLIVFYQYFVGHLNDDLAFTVLHFKYKVTIFAKQSEILCSVYASRALQGSERAVYWIDQSDA